MLMKQLFLVFLLLSAVLRCSSPAYSNNEFFRILKLIPVSDDGLDSDLYMDLQKIRGISLVKLHEQDAFNGVYFSRVQNMIGDAIECQTPRDGELCDFHVVFPHDYYWIGILYFFLDGSGRIVKTTIEFD